MLKNEYFLEKTIKSPQRRGLCLRTPACLPRPETRPSRCYFHLLLQLCRTHF